MANGEVAEIANAIQGPIHPKLGIAMDMSIQLKVARGAILTLSLSFNNDGPFGSFFRYIGDTGTYLAYYDELSDGKNTPIDLTPCRRVNEWNRTRRPRVLRRHSRTPEPQSSIAQTLPAYQTLERLEQQLGRVVAA